MDGPDNRNGRCYNRRFFNVLLRTNGVVSMNKSVTLKIFLILFTVFNVADAITAMFILPAESNPLYIWTGTMLVPVILKLLLVIGAWFIYYNNRYPSRTSYYSFIYIIIIGTFLIMLGVASNVAGILNDDIVEEGASASNNAKLSYYGKIMLILYIIPYTISVIAFKTYVNSESKVSFDKNSSVRLRIRKCR